MSDTMKRLREMGAINDFWLEFGERKDAAYEIYGRDLTDGEENALFVHHLRQALGLSPVFHQWPLGPMRRIFKGKRAEDLAGGRG